MGQLFHVATRSFDQIVFLMIQLLFSMVYFKSTRHLFRTSINRNFPTFNLRSIHTVFMSSWILSELTDCWWSYIRINWSLTSTKINLRFSLITSRIVSEFLYYLETCFRSSADNKNITLCQSTRSYQVVTILYM